MSERRPSLTAITALLCTLAVSALLAQGRGLPPADRVRDAERVIVGQVVSTQPVWRTTEHGDRLIVTVVHVAATETLKGAPASAVDVEVEGGTIDNLTLKVSDLPTFAAGDRAVFALRRTASGALVPHQRGDGLMKLDRSDRVPGANFSLSDVRSAVAAQRQ